MTARYIPSVLVARDEIVAPPTPRACQDHSFELPPGLYLATALMFLGFVGVLAFAFRNPAMAVPFGVIVAFIAAFFVIPAIFTQTGPDVGRTQPLSWQEFRGSGIVTATGRETAVGATTLVLLLPFLILCWAIAIATIAAVV